MPILMKQPTVEAKPTFEEEARQRLSQIRSACSGLVAACSQALGGSIRTATDLQRALGIRSTLAWQVYRVATSHDPAQELDAIPGPTAMRRVVDAARAKGVPKRWLDELTSAAREFNDFVRQHAGTRKTFNTIMAGLSGEVSEGSESLDVQYRREALHANSHLWGVRAQLILHTAILHPGSSNTLLRHATVLGKISLQRLRTDVPHRICAHGTYVNKDRGWAFAEPLATDGMVLPALLPEFSTNPLPPTRTIIIDDRQQVFLAPGPVGKAGAADFAFAGVEAEYPWTNGEDEPGYRMNTTAGTPAEVLVQDVFFHKSMFGRLDPQCSLYCELEKGPKIDQINPPEHTRRTARHRAVRLGTGAGSARMQEYPRYVELLEFICRSLGWEPSEFDVYRARVEYPILYGMYRMAFDLPEKGNW